VVEAAVERALADEGVHQFEAAGAEFLLVLVAALQEVERDGHFVDAQRGGFHLVKRRVISTCW